MAKIDVKDEIVLKNAIRELSIWDGSNMDEQRYALQIFEIFERYAALSSAVEYTSSKILNKSMTVIPALVSLCGDAILQAVTKTINGKQLEESGWEGFMNRKTKPLTHTEALFTASYEFILGVALFKEKQKSNPDRTKISSVTEILQQISGLRERYKIYSKDALTVKDSADMIRDYYAANFKGKDISGEDMIDLQEGRGIPISLKVEDSPKAREDAKKGGFEDCYYIDGKSLILSSAIGVDRNLEVAASLSNREYLTAKKIPIYENGDGDHFKLHPKNYNLDVTDLPRKMVVKLKPIRKYFIRVAPYHGTTDREIKFPLPEMLGPTGERVPSSFPEKVTVNEIL